MICATRCNSLAPNVPFLCAMLRATFHNTFMKTDKDAFLRVRNEGDKVTLTYKQFDHTGVDGAKEIEVEISDFTKTVEILQQAGISPSSIQESRRETWHMDTVEIVIDEWPWLKPYIEIEGPSESAVKQAATKLGLDWNNAQFGDVMVAYRAEYPHLKETDTLSTVSEVRFDQPLPDLLLP